MKHIVILATGGTIAGTAASSTNTTTYQSAALSITDLLGKLKDVPENIQVTTTQFAQVDSADMTDELWLKLAHYLNTLLQNSSVDGVVITHGTDTLEETAYFLNLVLKSKKPVVLVGAMRPASALSADGPLNLYHAVILAADENSYGKGVLVALNHTINSARDVRKTSTFLPNTFTSDELGYLGYILDEKPYFYRGPTRSHTYQTEFSIGNLTELPKVFILYGHSGDTGLLACTLENLHVDGLVYAGVGNGNMPGKVQTALRKLADRGIIIVRSTRVPNGIVSRNSAINDDSCRFIAADTLSPQKARILLMLALTTTTDLALIQKMYQTY